MVAGRGGMKKDGRKPSALEELFGSASDSEASTFYGFDDAELEDVLFSDSDEDSWLTPDDGNSWVAASLGCKGHFLERKWKIFFGGANWDYSGSPLKANFTAKIFRVILDFLKTFTSVLLGEIMTGQIFFSPLDTTPSFLHHVFGFFPQ